MSAITFEHFKMARAYKWLARILSEVSGGRFTESDKFNCREDVVDAFYFEANEALDDAKENSIEFIGHPWGKELLACCFDWLAASDEVLWQVYQACLEEGERVMENVLLDASSGSDPDWEWVQKCLEQVFQRKISNYIQNQMGIPTPPVDMSHNLETEEGQKRFAEYCSANRESINKRFGL